MKQTLQEPGLRKQTLCARFISLDVSTSGEFFSLLLSVGSGVGFTNLGHEVERAKEADFPLRVKPALKLKSHIIKTQ